MKGKAERKESSCCLQASGFLLTGAGPQPSPLCCLEGTELLDPAHQFSCPSTLCFLLPSLPQLHLACHHHVVLSLTMKRKSGRWAWVSQSCFSDISYVNHFGRVIVNSNTFSLQRFSDPELESSELVFDYSKFSKN